MRFITVATLVASTCLCLLMATEASTEQEVRALEEASSGTDLSLVEPAEGESAAVHPREKRTLLLKKKLIGAGLLGFGLGIAKGYKAGYHSAPAVRHVYLSGPPPPTVKYVEYVEQPVYVERIVERPVPVYKSVHSDFQPLRAPKDSSAPYGTW